MIARISVGPLAPAASPARASPARGGRPGRILDLELEPPAVDDDLDRGRTGGSRRTGRGDRAQAVRAVRPVTTNRPGPDGTTERVRPVAGRHDHGLGRRAGPTRRATRTTGRPGQRGHRSIARARPARPPRRPRSPGGLDAARRSRPSRWRRRRRHAPRAVAAARRPSAAAACDRDRERGGPLPLGDRRPSARRPSRSTASPARKRGSRGDEPVERQGRLDAADLGLVERPPQAVDRGVAVVVDDHELGDQGVVVGRDAVAGLDAGVDPDARAGGHLPAARRAGRRREVAGRVLGGEADLDRVAARTAASPLPPRGRAPTAGTPAASQSCSRTMSTSGDELGHAVLDLEPGVDLEEPERAVRSNRNSAVAALREPDGPRRPGRPPRGGRAARRSVRPGAGASSTSFWWRRWREQSRSPSATIVPAGSPRSWTSMWRAGRISRSR